MKQSRTNRRLSRIATAAALTVTAFSAHAAEHVTLRSGFAIDCIRRAPQGDKVRLFFTSGNATQSANNYMDVAASAILSIEQIPDPISPPDAPSARSSIVQAPADIPGILTHAGFKHNIDADLLASVVHAESGGHTRAVSRTGARGLMQLMPSTAASVGVKDAFAPDQNIEGGSTYLDALLSRYHDNIALALAAYNAGPAAVDRFHGVPPFRETRAYVSRVIREFNRRKSLLARNKTLLAQNTTLAANQPPQR
jgi:soluble lytic murein transglycosylase-like protein